MKIIGNREEGTGSIYQITSYRYYEGKIICLVDSATKLVIHRPEGSITVKEYETFLQEIINKDFLDLRNTSLVLNIESITMNAYVTNMPKIPIYTSYRGDEGVGVWVTNQGTSC